MNAPHVLLAAIVDYAGLFPPAGLDMEAAVRNYAAYRVSDDAWMLGRFVVPVLRLAEFRAARARFADQTPWPLSALLGDDVAGDVELATEFNAVAHSGATIDALEGRVTAPDDIATLAGLPVEAFSVFCELPSNVEPAPFVAALRQAGFNAKIRTGGITANAFPPAAWLVHAMRVCIDAGVPFKATAGLHHPIRGSYRLTYAESAPTGIMFGYLNLFCAAAFLANGVSEQDATVVLNEQDGAAFELLPNMIRWRDRTLDAVAIRSMRDRVAISFGSCSFREPVDELRDLAVRP